MLLNRRIASSPFGFGEDVENGHGGDRRPSTAHRRQYRGEHCDRCKEGDWVTTSCPQPVQCGWGAAGQVGRDERGICQSGAADSHGPKRCRRGP